MVNLAHLTQLENQVATAIELHARGGWTKYAVAVQLAPRIAAAIEAAGNADAHEDADAPLGYRTLALKALKETP